jgi:hypothetical protein
MSDITTIDTSLYEYYYLIDTQEDFKLYTRTPNGDVEFNNYGQFLLGDKTILAFDKSIKLPLINNFVLKTSLNEFVINVLDYEDYESKVTQNNFSDKSLYTIFNFIPSELHKSTVHNLILDYDKRCDNTTFSFIPYQIYDGVKTTTNDPTKINGSTLETFTPVMASTGTSSIVLTMVKDLGTSFRDWPTVTRSAKTLMGVMKLMIEWASLASEPFNFPDEVAQDAKTWIAEFKIPQNVLDEISETQEDMPLYRYLKGVPNARHGFMEQEELSPLFAAWFHKNMMYRTLNSISKNYPEVTNIPQEVLDREKSQIEATVYAGCLRYGIDYEIATSQEILNSLPEHDILPTGNLIRFKDVIKKRQSYQ